MQKVSGVLIYYLTVYPEVQEKLQEEIDDLFESKDETEEITADDITKMTYLDQVPDQYYYFSIYLLLLSVYVKARGWDHFPSQAECVQRTGKFLGLIL